MSGRIKRKTKYSEAVELQIFYSNQNKKVIEKSFSFEFFFSSPSIWFKPISIQFYYYFSFAFVHNTSGSGDEKCTNTVLFLDSYKYIIK